MNSKEKLAKKLGITVEELENRIQKNCSKTSWLWTFNCLFFPSIFLLKISAYLFSDNNNFVYFIRYDPTNIYQNKTKRNISNRIFFFCK